MKNIKSICYIYNTMNKGNSIEKENEKINISNISPIGISKSKISMREESIPVDASFNISPITSIKNSPSGDDYNFQGYNSFYSENPEKSRLSVLNPSQKMGDLNKKNSKESMDNIIPTSLEGEKVEVEDTIPKKFVYLEENNELQTLFTFCVSDSTEQIKVNLLFYKINMSSSLASYKGEFDDIHFENVPFVIFGGIENDSQFQLPYFTYDCVSAKNDDDIETNFRNECILNAIRIAGSSAGSAPDAYKGFIMYNNEIFVVIDTDMLFSNDLIEEAKKSMSADEVSIPTLDGEDVLEKWMDGGVDASGVRIELKWGLVDELIFERNVDGIKIEESYVTFLENHKFLWELEYNGHVLPFPYALYGLKEVEGNKYELKKDDDGDDHDQIEHDLLGLWYLFLADVSDIDRSVKYKKYACFVTKPKFYDEMDDLNINLDADSTEKSKDDEEKMNIGEELLTTSAIYFKHNGKMIWGIKYEEQFSKI